MENHALTAALYEICTDDYVPSTDPLLAPLQENIATLSPQEAYELTTYEYENGHILSTALLNASINPAARTLALTLINKTSQFWGKTVFGSSTRKYFQHPLNTLITYAPNLLTPNVLNALTLSTIEVAHKYGNIYQYEHDTAPELHLIERLISLDTLAERYYDHHENFLDYLDANPRQENRLADKGVNLGFWEIALTIPTIKERILPDIKKSNEPTQPTTALSSEAGVYKVLLANDAPILQKFMKKRILQDVLKDDLNAFATRKSFDAATYKIMGKNTASSRQHLIFSGAPGTGKTSLVHTLGRHLRDIGILPSGHVIEATATSLIGAYVGHSAQNTRNAIKAAKGGILFVDEIYHLVNDTHFGPDVTNQLLASMENEKEDFILVVAGYAQHNADFLRTNPGLRDRFAAEFNFPSFTDEQLAKLIELKFEEKGLSVTHPARDILTQHLAQDREDNPESFANARSVEKIVEESITAHAILLRQKFNDINAKFNTLSNLSTQDALTISADAAKLTITNIQNRKTDIIERQPIGFHDYSRSNHPTPRPTAG